jgi:hypothetical protein
MAGLMDTILKGLSSTDTVKSYQHASRIFVDGNFLRSPKYSFLFYVIFVYKDGAGGLGTPISRGIQIGALCKSAQLPKYTVDVQTLNAYNRPNIVQKKLKYDPVQLKFHDDSDDIIREFWYDYMTYYYRDSDYQKALYGQDHKYKDRQRTAWGYGLRDEGTDTAGGFRGVGDYHPLKEIRIYSFYNKKFSEYTLINPVISAFRHGEHSNDGSNLMEHEMTVQYEAVKYAFGYVSSASFGDSMLLLYDRQQSSLSAGVTRSIFGQGGLINTLDNVTNDLASGNYLGAFLKINKAREVFRGTNFSQLIKDEGLQMIGQAVRTGVNPLSTVSAPTIAGVTNSLLGNPGAIPGGGYTLLAAGGLILAGASRLGQDNNVGSQVRIATSTPTRRDDTVPRADYRATSGNQVVSTPYAVQQKTPNFPSLKTTFNATPTGVRNTNASEFITPARSASLDLNLNKSATVVSGRTQGTPRPQSPDQFATNKALEPSVVGLTYLLTKDELDAIGTSPTNNDDQVRRVTLVRQMERIFNSGAANSIINTSDLQRARDVYIADLKSPGQGAVAYGSATKFDEARTALLSAFTTKYQTAVTENRLNQFIGVRDAAEQIQNKLETIPGYILTDDEKKIQQEAIQQLKQILPDLSNAMVDTWDVKLILFGIAAGDYDPSLNKYKIN